MLGTIVVLAASALVAALELPALFRRKWRKEIFLYFVLLIPGTLLSIFAIRVSRIPSPLNIVIVVYKPVYEWFSYLLG
ncbi:hypothetical protein [Cohnella mopanensis]|uniref:hypothetical protein n=1 Tax=Cohnella mopanensis TaxID=2911966 RepID=UPI001EF97469|nr:hypothetical protein [Cohnella mopanensis]